MAPCPGGGGRWARVPPWRPERHPLPRFGSMIRLLIIYEATPEIFPIFPRMPAAGARAIVRSCSWAHGHGAAHMLGLWSSVIHGAPHERRGRNAIHRAGRVEVTVCLAPDTGGRENFLNPSRVWPAVSHINRWSRKIEKFRRCLVLPNSQLWHYIKRRFPVTSNLRYMYGVLNVDEIKN